MRQSYGVIWRGRANGVARGKLELTDSSVRLVGADAAAAVAEEIAYADLAGVHVGRQAAERIHGRPSLVLERSDGASISIVSLSEPGLIGELANRLAGLQRSNATQRAAVIVPLLPGSKTAVEAMLAEGPPFDPDELGLESHCVYVTDSEVVFAFAWRGEAVIESLLAEPRLWESAAAWSGLAAGPPRFADTAYTWSRPVRLDEALLPPGLHTLIQ
jgi:hypothetical protein